MKHPMQGRSIIFPWLPAMLFMLCVAPLPADAEIFVIECHRAVELYNRGTLSTDAAEKERLFKEAIPLCDDPEVLARIYNNLADVYENRGMFLAAFSHYRKAIAVKRDLVTPYVSMGDIYSRLGDAYSAHIMYGKALKYAPEDEDALKGSKESEAASRKKMVVYFDKNASSISDEYLYRLMIIGDAVNDAPSDRRIVITGHTCDLGSKTYNKKLSKKRAQAVAQYLRARHPVPLEWFIITGKGKAEPLLPNTDDDARTLNRRVEIRVE